jgi:hypothetical protein
LISYYILPENSPYIYSISSRFKQISADESWPLSLEGLQKSAGDAREGNAVIQ